MDGFDRAGVSFQNLSREYYDDELYDAFGYDVYGFTRAGLDFEGRDLEGYDLDGYDSQGFDRSGLDVENYDVQGRDRWGFNRFGWDWRGFSRHHRDSNDQPDRGYIVGADGNVREEPKKALRLKSWTAIIALSSSVQVQPASCASGDLTSSTTCAVCAVESCAGLAIVQESSVSARLNASNTCGLEATRSGSMECMNVQRSRCRSRNRGRWNS